MTKLTDENGKELKAEKTNSDNETCDSTKKEKKNVKTRQCNRLNLLAGITI